MRYPVYNTQLKLLTTIEVSPYRVADMERSGMLNLTMPPAPLAWSIFGPDRHCAPLKYIRLDALEYWRGTSQNAVRTWLLVADIHPDEEVQLVRAISLMGQLGFAA